MVCGEALNVAVGGSGVCPAAGEHEGWHGGARGGEVLGEADSGGVGGDSRGVDVGGLGGGVDAPVEGGVADGEDAVVGLGVGRADAPEGVHGGF